eukprot:1112757-Rhodomonas_salina.1
MALAYAARTALAYGSSLSPSAARSTELAYGATERAVLGACMVLHLLCTARAYAPTLSLAYGATPALY